MNFAEKLIKLRKQQGWSQEELADQLNVTRQSVSKWESMSSLPDLERMVKLSEIFNVSTDYLLKDDAEQVTVTAAVQEPAEDPELPERTVSAEEADSFLSRNKRSAVKIAAGVAMCIICPVPVMLLAGMSEQPGSKLSEAAAAGVGVGILLLMVAAAVGIFIMESFKLKRYEYLETDFIVTGHEVRNMAERNRENYETAHRISMVAGVSCCILAVVPLIVVCAFCEGNKFLLVYMEALMLVLIAFGVFLLVWTGMISESFDKLLEDGEYSRENKRLNHKNKSITAIYWCIVTAVYLAWSFITMNWSHTWIVWPVAGVLFGAIIGIANSIRSRHI